VDNAGKGALVRIGLDAGFALTALNHPPGVRVASPAGGRSTDRPDLKRRRSTSREIIMAVGRTVRLQFIDEIAQGACRVVISVTAAVQQCEVLLHPRAREALQCSPVMAVAQAVVGNVRGRLRSHRGVLQTIPIHPVAARCGT